LAGSFNSLPLGFSLIVSLLNSTHNSNIHRKNGKIKQKTKIARKNYLYQTISCNCKEYRKKLAGKNAEQAAAALPVAPKEKIFFCEFKFAQKNRKQYII
jgi:hypothetical protein